MTFRSNNRKSGNTFEHELCQELSQAGFWCHQLKQSAAGQPFDIIVARNRNTYPIDGKVCDKDVLRFDRIEPNQHSAMALWQDTGNGTGWFALRFKDRSVYMINYGCLMTLSRHSNTLSKMDVMKYGQSLREWIKEK